MRREGGARPTPRAILEARRLSRNYDELVALAPLDLTIGAGELVALVGPNGAGKTTLLKAAAGLLEPSQGSIDIAGARAGSLRARAATSYIPDAPALYDDLSLNEHLEYIAGLHGAEDWSRRGQQLLERLGLEDWGDNLPSQYSRGMRQKASIALGLVRPFSVLLADEPFDGLDPPSRTALLELLREAAAGGAAVVSRLIAARSASSPIAALRFMTASWPTTARPTTRYSPGSFRTLRGRPRTLRSRNRTRNGCSRACCHAQRWGPIVSTRRLPERRAARVRCARRGARPTEARPPVRGHGALLRGPPAALDAGQGAPGPPLLRLRLRPELRRDRGPRGPRRPEWVYVREDWLERLVLRFFEQRIFGPMRLERLAKQLRAHDREQRRNGKLAGTRIRQQIAELERKIKAQVQALEKGSSRSSSRSGSRSCGARRRRWRRRWPASAPRARRPRTRSWPTTSPGSRIWARRCARRRPRSSARYSRHSTCRSPTTRPSACRTHGDRIGGRRGCLRERESPPSGGPLRRSDRHSGGGI